MSNISLNIGGLIGAIIGAGIAIALIVTNLENSPRGRAPFKIVIIALLAGAVAGNVIWSKLFDNESSESE